jgi:hypothetical protein
MTPVKRALSSSNLGQFLGFIYFFSKVYWVYMLLLCHRLSSPPGDAREEAGEARAQKEGRGRVRLTEGYLGPNGGLGFVSGPCNGKAVPKRENGESDLSLNGQAVATAATADLPATESCSAPESTATYR